MQKYNNFKQVLEYFVTHLEFIQNENTNIKGYAKYLKPFIDSGKFKKQGSGYSEKRYYKIQEQISAFSEYEFGKIFITIIPSKSDGSYTDKGCYLHWLSTAINIVAVWERQNKKYHVTGLQILLAKRTNKKWVREVIDEKSLVDLDLFSKKKPNKKLKDFYNSFESLLFNNGTQVLELEKKFEIINHKAPGKRLFRSSKCEKEIDIKHTEIQDEIVQKLKAIYGKNAVFQEVVIQNTRLDVLVEIKKGNDTLYDIYEIKPYNSFYSCIREAIGQLIEYKYKSMEYGLTIRNLYIVGPAKKDMDYIKYIQTNYGVYFDYIQL